VSKDLGKPEISMEIRKESKTNEFIKKHLKDEKSAQAINNNYWH